jgi:hypothetical protein
MPNWMPDLLGPTGPTGPTGDGAAGFTAAPVSIGGTAVIGATAAQDQIDAIVAALVALGLVTDDRA